MQFKNKRRLPWTAPLISITDAISMDYIDDDGNNDDAEKNEMRDLCFRINILYKIHR